MGLWQAIDISTEIEIKGWNGMASWKLCVEDYGKIKSAEMECAPLTLIVGDNNCGKSYLMSLLWGIKNIGAIHLFEKRDAEINEEERLLKDWISQQINLAFENGSEYCRDGRYFRLVSCCYKSAAVTEQRFVIKMDL